MSVFGRRHSATSAPRVFDLAAFILQPTHNQHPIALTATLVRQRGRQFTTVTWLLPLGVKLIPGGRYTHLAWLRTASDTVSSLGTDP